MELDTCFATLTDGCLRIGNALIEREWRIAANGLLHPTALIDHVSGTEWLESAGDVPPIHPEGRLPDEMRTLALHLSRGKHCPTEGMSLVATLTAAGEQVTVVTTFQVFPDCPALSMQVTCRGATGDAVSSISADPGQPTGIETVPGESGAGFENDVMDVLVLALQHLRLTVVTLRDQTDRHDELVHEEEMLLHPNKNSRDFEGILFAIEDPLLGHGLVMVKEAPLPHACPVAGSPALQVRGHTCTIRGHGTGGDGLPGYRLTIMTYSGGSMGRTATLQRWQRTLRQYQPGRDGLLVTNTWGDRSQDSRLNEPFMAGEVEGCAGLGADVVQIDDGWQQGRTANSIVSSGVWEGFWKVDPEFWEVNRDRFPHGLEKLIQRARELGMEFGLWFAPDSAGDFANWRKDADCILALHRTLRVDFFKIDGVKAGTKQGERNLRLFFDRVLGESDGKIVFDLDVTAGIRPGYFGMINVGPVFVENRYTDWFNYWPHRTLRNLWQLARWIDPLRLRMEFLNNARNTERYDGDPLAPGAYSPACLFASVLFSSPLGWFEASGLAASYVAQVATLAEIRRDHQDALFSGFILPVGSVPDGVLWTGFVSVDSGHASAYALVFRELSTRTEWTLALDGIIDQQDLVLKVLAGEGTVDLVGEGVRFSIPEPLGFLFVRLEGSG